MVEKLPAQRHGPHPIPQQPLFGIGEHHHVPQPSGPPEPRCRRPRPRTVRQSGRVPPSISWSPGRSHSREWVDHWLYQIAKPQRRHNTFRGYESSLRKWVAGSRLSTRRLDQLAPAPRQITAGRLPGAHRVHERNLPAGSALAGQSPAAHRSSPAPRALEGTTSGGHGDPFRVTPGMVCNHHIGAQRHANMRRALTPVVKARAL
jgi:hypothetical protein